MLTRRRSERAREVWTGRRVSELSAADVEAARAAGYEPGGDGWLVGRDPREMGREEIEAMGHRPMGTLEAIREKCLDCCAGSASEVRKCVAMACPSWPFRMGWNPWRAPRTPEQIAKAREIGLRNLGRSKKASSLPEKFSGDGEGYVG